MNIYTMKKETYSNCLPAWKSAGVGMVLIGVFTIMDATTLYSCFEKLMVEKVFMSVLLTVVLALVLNVIPAILAVLVAEERSVINRTMTTLLLAAFLVLFVSCFALRWSEKDTFYSTASVSLLVNGQESVQSEAVKQGGKELLVLIMGLEPLLTSILSFCITYENPKEKKKRILTLENYKYEEKKKLCEVQLQELELELQRDFVGEEEQKYKEFLDMLEYQKKMEYQAVREKLAKRLGSADAISRLLQEG